MPAVWLAKQKRDRAGQQHRKYHHGNTNIPGQVRTEPGNRKAGNAQAEPDKDRRPTFERSGSFKHPEGL